MKKIQSVILLIMSIMLCTTTISCNKDDNNDNAKIDPNTNYFLGTWVTEGTNDTIAYKYQFVFNSDNTLKISMASMKNTCNSDLYTLSSADGSANRNTNYTTTYTTSNEGTNAYAKFILISNGKVQNVTLTINVANMTTFTYDGFTYTKL